MFMRKIAASLLAFAGLLSLTSVAPAADLFRVASPNRGSWEGAIPELGKQAGIFQKHGLNLDIIYTSGGGETMQVVISGAVDVGLSAGLAGTFGAFSKGAPVRIIGASSTGSREIFYYVPAKSPITSLREANGKTIAYSTAGSSTQVGALRFMAEYGLKDMKPTATGDAVSTTTQAMTGQVDIGWCVAPFNLDVLARGDIRMIGRLSDLEHLRKQTIRVQIANAQALEKKKDLFVRYLRAYREVLDWMYASDDAVQKYIAITSLPEASVRAMLAEFIPKESLQIDEVRGIPEAMQDAVQFKFISAPLDEKQVSELIQIKALK
jgi:NitT/TauT family transport system substrate-binding protein